MIRGYMALTDEPEEILDLVNDQDVVIGTVTREEVQDQLMQLPGMVRSSDVFIINDRGEIWVPRRSPHKQVAPNGLDYSAGEHIKAGETYIAGMLRGMQEELNLRLAEENLEYLGKVSNAPVGIPYFNSIFIYYSNEVPQYNTDDFSSYEWLKPDVFLQRVKAGEPAKRDLKLALELLLKS